MAITFLSDILSLLSKEWPFMLLLLKIETQGKILVLTLRYEKNRRIQKKLVKHYSENQHNKLLSLMGREKKTGKKEWNGFRLE